MAAQNVSWQRTKLLGSCLKHPPIESSVPPHAQTIELPMVNGHPPLALRRVQSRRKIKTSIPGRARNLKKVHSKPERAHP